MQQLQIHQKGIRVVKLLSCNVCKKGEKEDKLSS